MDRHSFDRFARALAAALPRRAALGGLLGGLLGSTVISHEVSAKRKRRKKKNKKKRCAPNCAGKVCGPNGCGGSCGSCSGSTRCDAQGRCVDCATATDCAAVACQAATCAASVCQYAPIADGTNCGGSRVCCSGGCTDTRWDAANCDGCGMACDAGQACVAGQCRMCDVCASGCAHTTLQAAVTAANAGATVTLCPGVYVGQTFITKDLTVRGLGADPTATVLTNPTGRIVTSDFPKTVTLRNVTVSGVNSGFAPAILNQGTMTLQEVHVIDNTATANGGGLVTNSVGNVAILIDSVVRGNAAREGAGIYTFGGTATTLIRTRIEDNEAREGGGIYNQGAVNLTDNSVITGNTATGNNGVFGGGIVNIGANAALVINSGGRIEDNTPDDCIDEGGATACPA